MKLKDGEVTNLLMVYLMFKKILINIELIDFETFTIIDVQYYFEIPLKERFPDKLSYKKFVNEKTSSSDLINSNFINLEKLNCIPVEITVVEYNLKKGVTNCYHDFIEICNNNFKI